MSDPGGALALATELAWRGAALVAAVALASVALRRASAAFRHLLWALTFLCLALLPGLPGLAPHWEAAVVPAPLAELVSGAAIDPDSAGEPGAEPVRGEATERRLGRTTSGEGERAAGPAGGSVGAGGEPGGRSGDPPPSDRGVPTDGALALLWLIGTTISASRLLLARRRLVRAGDPVRPGSGWECALEDARRSVGLERPVRLRIGSDPAVPLTLGFLRPIVLLPERASEWDPVTRRHVLLHEVVHVRRADDATTLAAALVRAVYWWHPLVRYAFRRLVTEREAACDDRVVEAGSRRADYAGSLVRVAAELAGRRPAPEPAGLGTPPLAGRVRALLDSRRCRNPLSRRGALGGAGLIAALTVAVAGAVPVGGSRSATSSPSPARGAASDQAAVPLAEPAVSGTERSPGSRFPAAATPVARQPRREPAQRTALVEPALPRVLVDPYWPRQDPVTRWTWAVDRVAGTGRPAWIGWSIQRLLPFDGHPGSEEASLRRLLWGEQAPELARASREVTLPPGTPADGRPVWQEFAVLVRVGPEGAVEEARLLPLDHGAPTELRPLLWIGAWTRAQSLARLEGLMEATGPRAIASLERVVAAHGAPGPLP